MIERVIILLIARIIRASFNYELTLREKKKIIKIYEANLKQGKSKKL